MIKARQLPLESPWYWTDDTAMALTIVRMLHLHGEIRQDGLAEMFGATYQAHPYRGYGYGMTVLLPRLAEHPGMWGVHARSLFGGQGSLGNGAAMRAAPQGLSPLAPGWPASRPSGLTCASRSLTGPAPWHPRKPGSARHPP